MAKRTTVSIKTATKKKARKQRISPSMEWDIPMFRTRLLRAIDQRGVNQRQIALKLGRDPRQINLVCLAKHKPDLKMLAGFGEILDISVDWLLGIGKRPALDEESGRDATMTFNLNGDEALPVTLPKVLLKQIFGDNYKGLDLISIQSSDMAPTFREGDLAFVQRTGFQNKGGSYLIKAGGSEIIRRLNWDPVSSKVTIWAEAQKDEKNTVPLSKVQVVGPVFRFSGV